MAGRIEESPSAITQKFGTNQALFVGTAECLSTFAWVVGEYQKRGFEPVFPTELGEVLNLFWWSQDGSGKGNGVKVKAVSISKERGQIIESKYHVYR